MLVVLAIAVLVTTGWLSYRITTRRRPLAPIEVVEDPAPVATMRLLFVADDDREFEIDGLLDIEEAAIGVPTTWGLSAPIDPRLRVLVSWLLHHWADDDAVVTVDLARLDDRRPSIALDADGSHVRLGVARRPSLSAG